MSAIGMAGGMVTGLPYLGRQCPFVAAIRDWQAIIPMTRMPDLSVRMPRLPSDVLPHVNITVAGPALGDRSTLEWLFVDVTNNNVKVLRAS